MAALGLGEEGEMVVTLREGVMRNDGFGEENGRGGLEHVHCTLGKGMKQSRLIGISGVAEVNSERGDEQKSEKSLGM